MTDLRLTSHTGTHMDAPAHLLDGGAAIDELPPELFVLPAVVAECTGDSVGPADLAGLQPDGRAVLLRTAGGDLSRDRFRPGYPHLRPEAAEALRDGGAALLGVDYLSVDPPGGEDAHRILLEAGIPIVEDLLLRGADPGEYVLVCLPLRISAGDGAPVRAFLSPL